MLLAGVCQSKVAPTTLHDLTARSGLVVIGRVTRLLEVKGVRVAEVRVTSTLKGSAYSTIYYLAQPTWICDITKGTVGEEALFFFTGYSFDPEPVSMLYVRSADRSGAYAVENGASRSGQFKEPLGFRDEIRSLVGSSSFWQVSWSGRGRMPIREVHGTKYVTLWIGDVALPPSIPTISGPEREYRTFIRSASLSGVAGFVLQQVRDDIRHKR